MEEWEIAFVEEHNLHPNILNDIEMGICPRELGYRLAVFSYELRNAYFLESYIVSKVQTAYMKSKSLKNVQDKIAKIDEYRTVYRKKAEEWSQFLDSYALKKGYVYIFSNKYMPGLIKIGYTEKNDVNERKDELYYQGKPGVPYPFDVEFAKYTVCPDRSEKGIHERLWKYRVNENREFFKIKAKKAKTILNQVISETESILVNHFNKVFSVSKDKIKS